MKFSKVMYAVTTHETMDVRSDFLYDDSLLGKVADEIIIVSGFKNHAIRDKLLSKKRDEIDHSIRVLERAYAAAEEIIRLVDEERAATEKLTKISGDRLVK